MWSKYRTKASDQPMSCWNFLHCASFAHLSQVDVQVLLSFPRTSKCIFCLVVMLLPQVRSVLMTSRTLVRCTKEGRFEKNKVFSDAQNISWLGQEKFPHAQKFVLSSVRCPQERRCILGFFSSMSFTLHISKIAWQDSWLNTIFFFARSSRMRILFEPVFDSFNLFCICFGNFFFRSVSL